MAWASTVVTPVYTTPETLETTAEVFHISQTGGDVTLPAVSLTGSTNVPYWLKLTFTIPAGSSGAAKELAGVTIPANTVILSALHKVDSNASTGLNSATLAYTFTTGTDAIGDAAGATTAYTALAIASGDRFTAVADTITATLAAATVGASGCTVTLALLCTTAR